MDIKNYLNETFLKDHQKIEQQLNIILEQLRNNLKILELLKKLNWFLNRHFYLEEKFLYLNHENSSQISKNLIHRLMSDHDKILNILKDFLSNPNQIPVQRFKDLKSLINKHKKFEIEHIYEKLMNSLNQNELTLIEEKLRKNVKLGFYPLQKVRNYGKKMLN
jgi:hypothetical protein